MMEFFSYKQYLKCLLLVKNEHVSIFNFVKGKTTCKVYFIAFIHLQRRLSAIGVM